jgi:phosphate starvation-inducible PhoH-like protein
LARQKPSQKKNNKVIPTPNHASNRKQFHFEFLNPAQKLAWATFDQHDVLFLLGPAGVGKSHLAIAFAISEVLAKRKKRIILTRPVVEAGESLGFLPGSLEEKVNPYMLPMYDCISRCVGYDGPLREIINNCIELAPVAYLRGRSEPLDSLIMTPNGQKRMGDIAVGDLVIGSNGKPIKVLGVYPQGQLEVYRVKFSDGTSVKCSGNHLWSTMSLSEKRHNKGYTTKTTLEIMDYVKTKHGQKNHRIPQLSAPVMFDEQHVPIDPYLLGVLLGDGHIRKGAVLISNVDEEILEECRTRIPTSLTLKYKGKCDYRIVSNDKNNVLLNDLRLLDLVGKKSPVKFVPDIYKFNSEHVRLEVLRGLLDTDGYIGHDRRTGNYRIQFYSTSCKLAKDVEFLVRSLGGYTYSRKREFDENDSHEYKGKIIRHVHPSYVVDIVIAKNPFKLPRKSERFKNNRKTTKLISAVEYCGVEECQCIQVDSPDHLYVTGDFILTHNTFHDSICIFDEAQNATETQLKLFLTRFGENSKVIITGDPKQSDLPHQYQGLMHIVNKLEDLNSIGVIQFKSSSIVRHPLISSILERLEGSENG